EFRDIIYGNVQNVSRELRRFNLLESSRYQNVPRTIQNIFLNQSLESRVIKDTIIDSMDFTDDSIDLNFYREHVKDFRQQYEDIWKWYKKEKNGKTKVKSDAENVISKYSLYEVTRSNIKDLCARLNYAFERDTETLPKIEECIAEKQEDLSRQKRLLSEEKGQYNKEREDLKGMEAVLNDFLRQIKDKAQRYSDIGIETIINRISKENELQIRKKSLVHQENTLTDKNQSVKARYNAMLQDIDSSLKEYMLQAGQQINEAERKQTEEISVIQAEFNAKTNELNSTYQQKYDEIQENIDTLTQEKTEHKLHEQQISHSNPFGKEMESLSAQIHELEEKRNALTILASQKQHDITRITNETESARIELENACEKDLLETKHAK
ncbi:MAG: hypothetical protein K2G80_07830, partial [Bacteroidales bacterium]|nr:hypothetical protein [Bacteroidales bacterium]